MAEFQKQKEVLLSLFDEKRHEHLLSKGSYFILRTLSLECMSMRSKYNFLKLSNLTLEKENKIAILLIETRIG
jgi:hypothetical protein